MDELNVNKKNVNLQELEPELAIRENEGEEEAAAAIAAAFVSMSTATPPAQRGLGPSTQAASAGLGTNPFGSVYMFGFWLAYP
jgi:hypothetical protein